MSNETYIAIASSVSLESGIALEATIPILRSYCDEVCVAIASL
jgi:hypothetical protein